VKRPTPPALRHLEGKLRELDDAGLLRARAVPVAEVARTFCSNDYLGLAASREGDAGAGASRLIVGERPEHLALEAAIAEWLDVESVLLFSSGYAANVGAIGALVARDDLVVSDALNHASIIDGCRLARAQVEVVPHLDVSAIESALKRARAGRAWVITESYFSMDADGPDLSQLRAACDQQGAALVLDEAHALGVFGPRGRGLAAEAGIEPDVRVGTLGKAFGASGAFVAGCTALGQWLWNRARSFVFSTGMSPLVASAAMRAIHRIAPDDLLRARLHENVRLLRGGLSALGLHPLGTGPIVPLVIGDSRRAVEAAAELRRGGVHVQAVRPPTVPEGTARLRITTTARHTREDIEQALVVFRQRLEWLRPSS
jgi:8-amino-7-oxononanoate synthase